MKAKIKNKIYIIIMMSGAIFSCSFKSAPSNLNQLRTFYVTVKDANDVNEDFYNFLKYLGCSKIEKITLNQNKKENIVFKVYTVNDFNKVKLLSKNNNDFFIEEGNDGKPAYTPSDEYYRFNWFNSEIEIEKAWDISKGSKNVKVAVLDTGVDFSHEDLSLNKNQSVTFSTLSSDKNFYADDHGTAVAGIIGAKHNGIGVAGIAPNVDLISINISSIDDNKIVFDFEASLDAINYCTLIGVDIINLSGYDFDYTESMKSVIEDFPGLLVACAGNNGINIDSSPTYPASYDLDNILVVGNYGHDGNKWLTSNYGEKSVDIFAPGTSIMSTAAKGYESTYEKYGTYSGTSFATPIVSGLASLILSENPNYTNLQVKNAILNSVNKKSTLSSYCLTGGIIDCYNALHKHNYIEYSYIDTKYHFSICECGEKIKSGHVVAGGSFSEGQRYATCLLCGGEAEMGFVVGPNSSSSINDNQYELIHDLYFIKETKLIDGILNLDYEDYLTYLKGDLIL